VHAQTTNRLQLIKQWDIYPCPNGVAVDSNGNIFIADINNNAVRRFMPKATPRYSAPDSMVSGQRVEILREC
jgi:sugar lactone lactonase YvrE